MAFWARVSRESMTSEDSASHASRSGIDWLSSKIDPRSRTAVRGEETRLDGSSHKVNLRKNRGVGQGEI